MRLEDHDIFDKDENDGNEKSASWYIEAASGGPWRVLSSSPQPRFVPRKKKTNGPQISTLGTILRNPFLLFGSLILRLLGSQKAKENLLFLKIVQVSDP